MPPVTRSATKRAREAAAAAPAAAVKTSSTSSETSRKRSSPEEREVSQHASVAKQPRVERSVEASLQKSGETKLDDVGASTSRKTNDKQGSVSEHLQESPQKIDPPPSLSDVDHFSGSSSSYKSATSGRSRSHDDQASESSNGSQRKSSEGEEEEDEEEDATTERGTASGSRGATTERGSASGSRGATTERGTASGSRGATTEKKTSSSRKRGKPDTHELEPPTPVLLPTSHLPRREPRFSASSYETPVKKKPSPLGQGQELLGAARSGRFVSPPHPWGGQSGADQWKHFASTIPSLFGVPETLPLDDYQAEGGEHTPRSLDEVEVADVSVGDYSFCITFRKRRREATSPAPSLSPSLVPSPTPKKLSEPLYASAGPSAPKIRQPAKGASAVRRFLGYLSSQCQGQMCMSPRGFVQENIDVKDKGSRGAEEDVKGDEEGSRGAEEDVKGDEEGSRGEEDSPRVIRRKLNKDEPSRGKVAD